jgi:hypothetical protein
MGSSFLIAFYNSLLFFKAMGILQYWTVLAANGKMIVHWKRIGGK